MLALIEAAKKCCRNQLKPVDASQDEQMKEYEIGKETENSPINENYLDEYFVLTVLGEYLCLCVFACVMCVVLVNVLNIWFFVLTNFKYDAFYIRNRIWLNV